MLKRKGEFLDVMRRLQEEHHYNMVILMLTDVLLEGTQLLYVGSDEAIRNAFSAEPKDNALFLPGVMSRKNRSFPCCPPCGDNFTPASRAASAALLFPPEDGIYRQIFEKRC